MDDADAEPDDAHADTPDARERRRRADATAGTRRRAPAVAAAAGAVAPSPPPRAGAPQRPGQRSDGGRMLEPRGRARRSSAIGLWFFAERTLGIDMPDIRWSQLWPVILIVIGVVVLLGALRRDRR